MKLLSSLKPKKRYIVFEIISDVKFSLQEVEKAVMESLLSFIGTLGVAKAAVMFIKEKVQENKFILKVNNKFVDECKTGVILTKEIKNSKVIIKSIVTSGTLKKASNYL